MIPVFAGFLIGVGISILTCLYYYNQHIKGLISENKILRGFDHNFPVWSRFYYDRHVGYCRRCKKGKIVWRWRFQIVPGSEGGTTVRSLTTIYYCTGCNFKSSIMKGYKAPSDENSEQKQNEV